MLDTSLQAWTGNINHINQAAEQEHHKKLFISNYCCIIILLIQHHYISAKYDLGLLLIV